jgi:hypothetical protein
MSSNKMPVIKRLEFNQLLLADYHKLSDSDTVGCTQAVRMFHPEKNYAKLRLCVLSNRFLTTSNIRTGKKLKI